MSVYKPWYLTKYLASAIQSANTSNNKITFKYMFGSSDSIDEKDYTGLTNDLLKSIKLEDIAKISSNDVSNTDTTVVAVFTNKGVVNDHTMNTIGIVAEYNGKEFLAAICSANTPYLMPKESDNEHVEYTIRAVLGISNTGVVSVVMDPSAVATNEQLDKVRTSLKSTDDKTIINQKNIADIKDPNSGVKVANASHADRADDANYAGEAAIANYKNNLLKDGSDISLIETSGYYYARNASGITGVPKDFNSKYFDVTTWVNGSNGFMFIVDDFNNLYYRKRQNGVWQDYTPMPLDANKFTRNDRRETIHEEWTFEKQLHATVDYAYRNILIKVNENYSADNLTEPGTYCAENGHLVGLPAYPIWGTLEVMKNIEGDVIQRFNVTNGMTAYVIQRIKNNGGWQPWRTIA
ncbi:pyocin knob domain-containing protein [Fructobacillus tropaeoli]|uniref:Uncharacterized protein n=1 Tax=Fructobacillus tropaeoli TaxID=709323 RepID=A0A3F3HI28_9LACO|nr:pyocin knob domain-containing protein [Fructobacillus tropaeoli]GAP04873.1 hypothetical protein FTRO_0110080 [Fructobacillus tropaeoli]